MTACRSNDKRSFHIITIIRAVVLDLVVPVAAEMVEAETVGFGIDDVEQASFEGHELRRIDLGRRAGLHPPGATSACRACIPQAPLARCI